jgi:hypothetical protein
MHSVQETTAERTNTALIQPVPIGTTHRLNALGQLLYGEHWLIPMARDLKIRLDTMTQWASGKCELPPDHPIFVALAVLVHHHDKGVAKAWQIMDRNEAYSVVSFDGTIMSDAEHCSTFADAEVRATPAFRQLDTSTVPT